ncbi:LPS assembly protein LptD [Arenimonas fontis]|uniref:LPS-assembly protein LptD n=1 Tax=Arenimonas fontis TaxID=2608255 RepID=A0A5B2Z433_9GAMM|nr:LPS assembly protein LptD [Arenimonas fontis]KAA2283698.1 LPS assembly protein LptD [Arenimonas fontis]
MRRPVLRLLPFCLAMACAARAQDAPGSEDPLWQRCPLPGTLPEYRPRTEGAAPAREGAPTDVTARELDLSRDEVTVLTGEVELSRGDQWLGTDRLTWEHEGNRFHTDGPVRYQDRRMRFAAGRASGDSDQDRIELENVQYQFNDGPGNGRADSVVMLGERGSMAGATYSTCPPGQRQWEFSADDIEVDGEEGMGTARNATLRIGKVPVLWTPWIRFPTDDRRRTGLLWPKIGYDDRNGFDYEQPIYLNLAPNYDVTLSPRWLSRRGLMLGGEFRYLTERSRGEIAGDWLPDDDLSGRDRGLASWRHSTRFSRHWQFGSLLQHVSDRSYFDDFGESLAGSTITLLHSHATLQGRGQGWDLRLGMRDWQAASLAVSEFSEPYRELPSLQARWNRWLAPWAELDVRAEAVRFSHELRDGGDRLDLQPSLRLPFGGAAWFLTPQLSWRYTTWSLDEGLALPDGDTRPSRSLPIWSLDAGAYFDRELTWLGRDLLHTLEPRLFYLKAPYREQDDLPLFDTRPLTFGWPGLFRSNRFSGGDRQADADQVTLALSTRLFDADDGRELLSAGVGRVHYFETPRVTIPGAPLLSDEGSAWVAEASIALARQWRLSLAHQWEPEDERTSLSAVRSQWRFGEGGLVNLAYRYRADLLEQGDLSFVLPVHRDWRLVGRWNYSLRDRQTLEALGGLEWKSCCVAVRLLARRYVRESGDYGSGIYLEFELNGVGSFGRDTVRLLDDAILDYSR